MAHAFKTVVAFLDRQAGEVEGRTRSDPSDEIKKKMLEFAAGKLSDGEREEMVKLLKANPDWVSMLADEVKALRPRNPQDKNQNGPA